MGDVVTIQEALARVMATVQAVRKDGFNKNQQYNFRGVDAVVNAVGPALREHGVIVLPLAESAEYESYTSKGGGAMKGCVVRVRFVFVGPAGDTLECCVYGESSDAGDKATPKAHSVAFRTALLEALCIPTDEPDPDADSHERERPKATRVKPTPAGPALPSLTDNQHAAITALLGDLTDKEKAPLMAWWSENGYGSLKKRELSAAHAEAVQAELERIVEARAAKADGSGDPVLALDGT